MAERLKNLTALFSNVRTRTILFATGGILILVVIIGLIGFHNTQRKQQENASLQTNRSIQSIPGLTAATPEYASVQSSLNAEQYRAAEKTQGTAIPTVIGQAHNVNAGGASNTGFQSLVNPGGTGGGGANAEAGANAGGQETTNGTANPEASQQQAEIASLQEQLKEANQKAEAGEEQNIQSAMQQQAQQLMASWATSQGGVAEQQYVEGERATAASTSSTSTQTTTAGTSTTTTTNTVQEQPPAAIKAGTVLIGVLNTSVNSDEPSPILATVVQGPYKGAKFIGSMQETTSLPGTNGSTRVILNFTTMNIPYAPNTVGVSAVAIDLNTARTALASQVDHHYLERYGSLFASAFLEGYGSAIQQSGSTVTNSIFGGSSQSYGNLSSKQELGVGLGQVGQAWGNQLGQVLSRPNTITVNAGTGIGILFLNDATLTPSNLPTTVVLANTTTNTTQTNT